MQMQKQNKILFGSEAESSLYSGIEKISKAVKSTLGPRGKSVVIESQHHSRGLTITKDGVTVAKSIYLEDPTEDLAVRLVLEAAQKTATQAGDGTSTSIVLAEAVLLAAKKYTNSRSNMTRIITKVKELSEEVISKLEERSVPVQDGDLKRIASISANNDEELGSVIAEAYLKAGENGSVMVDRSPNDKTYFELTSGMQFKRGLLSPYSVTDTRKQSCEMENPLILLSSVELPSFHSIERVMAHVIQSGRPLFIIGNLSQESMQSFNHNVSKGIIRGCYIIPPSFGDRSRELMSDMAISFGAKYIDESQGDSWELLEIGDLGTAAKVSVTRDTTSISRSEDEQIGIEVAKRVEDLQAQIVDEKDEFEIESLKERISKLSGRVATIYVGAQSEIEQKEKKDRADDSVLATKAAIEEGILPGGGLALMEAVSGLNTKMTFIQRWKSLRDRSKMNEDLVARLIIKEALMEPISQIIRNSGRSKKEIKGILNLVMLSGYGFGFDAKKDIIVDMVESGIIDPSKVTKKSVQNAVSVSTTIMNTSAIITNVR